MAYDYGRCHACGAEVEERLTEQCVPADGGWIFVQATPTGVCTRCGEHIFRWDVGERLEALVSRRRETTPMFLVNVPVFSYQP